MLKEKYLEKWSCHSSPMVTNLMTPDVKEKKLNTCPEKKNDIIYVFEQHESVPAY